MHYLILILTGLALTGCAAHPGPIIDTQGVNMGDYERDLAQCSSYSSQIQTARGVAKGAAAGAAVGAVAGAISGDAAEGAGLGALGGASHSALRAEQEKQQVVKNCLRGRGYRVLN